MADIVNSATRSRMMSGIRAKNTNPELKVRLGLHRMGFRYSLHRRDLPGTPDITLAKHRAVVFVHGCFWHGHVGCRLAKVPSTRLDFWTSKLAGNRARDLRQLDQLRASGWRVAIVWECALRKDAERTLADLAEFLRSSDPFAEIAFGQEPKIE
jgi:DNA mismatch endonuclease (patch repair protein)